MPINRQILLNSRPDGFPELDNFRLVESELSACPENHVVIRTQYLSVDPYMRGRMRDRASYAPPVKLGDVMVGECVGVIQESRSDRFQIGDTVAGEIGWQEYGMVEASKVRKVKPGLPPSTALHVVGMPGLTAYFGLLHICEPKKGETVVVSGAAGAVGTAVGQIAKLKGCRVVGIAGSDEKISFITNELGFDAGINYKTTESVYKDLKTNCPDGIDVYFDNVGGPITDSVFPLINVHSRMAICGQISQYNASEAEMGPRVLWNLIVKRAKVQGLLVSDFAAHFGQAAWDLHNWVAEGKLKYRETITQGIENAPQAFIDLLSGGNIGKQLVQVSDS